MSILYQSTKDFAAALLHDLENLPRSIQTVGIQAPTGVGKTSVMLNMFRKSPGTLMIFPTQLACQQWMDKKQTGDCIFMMNASRTLETLIRRNGLSGYKTIIMDEAHVDSKEYYAIRKMMQHARRKDQRFFFVSATLPISLLREEFRHLYPLNYDDFRPYLIDIRYVPSVTAPYRIDRQHLLSKAAECLVEVCASKKVLVFQPTHDDCDDFAKRVQAMRIKNLLPPMTNMGSCPVLVLHGGLEPEEKETIKKKLITESVYLLIATNIAESSITLPDLEVIIDSGLECRCQNNYTNVNRASKMSLIQRAGRVGRTRDGVVYRLMTSSIFDGLEDFSEQYYFMDSVVVSCLWHGSDARRLFGENIIGTTLSFLSSIGVDHKTSHQKLEFLQFSRMGMLTASLLWNLILKKSCDLRERMWIMLLLVIVEQYDKTSLQWVYSLTWVYHPKKTTHDHKMALNRLDKFRYCVCYEKDMLVSIARMLLTILSYGREWRTVAGMLSLNQKYIREFVTDWNRTYSLLAPTWKEKNYNDKNSLKPLDALMTCLDIPESFLPKDKSSLYSYEVIPIDLDPDLVFKGRSFFHDQPILYGPKLMESVYYGMDDDEDAEYNDDDNLFSSVYGHKGNGWRVDGSVYRSAAVPESLKRLPKAIHPLRLREDSLDNVMLWTNLPYDLDQRHQEILNHVECYQDKIQAKQIVRELQKNVQEELNETVAMMPPSDNDELDPECRFSGGYLWKEAQDDFHRLLAR